MNDLFLQVVDTIQRFHLLTQNDRILVAVSGGPDSIALFHLLWKLKDDFNFHFVLAHINHRIRSDAYKDEELVCKEAEEHGVQVVRISIDVPALKEKSGLSLETVAREARYQFFEEQAKKLNLNRVALGHTAHDQAETIVMRLLRGSGLNGMGGIAPLRGNTVCYVRPLIQSSRDQIMKFLHKENIPYRHDASNFKADCLRNKIRLHLMPTLIKEYNPNLVKTLQQTGILLRDDYDYLQAVAQKKFNKICTRENNKSVTLSLPLLRALHPSLLRMVMRIAIKKINKGTLSRIHFSHLEAIERLLFKDTGGLHLDLPCNITIEKDAASLIIGQKETRTKSMSTTSHTYLVKVPGALHIPELSLMLETSIIPSSKFSGINKDDPFSAYFDYDSISHPLYVRTRRPGDRFYPLGLCAHKKLKEFFIDRKIPRWKRDKWPILVAGEEIIWIIDLRMANAPKVTSKTKVILYVHHKIINHN